MPSAWISRSDGGGSPTPPRATKLPLRALFADARAPDAWLARWRARCASESTAAQIMAAMALERAQGDAPASIPT